MRATRKDNLPEKMCVDTDELRTMLCCGRKSAVEIGSAAGARVTIGRRVLWNTEKVKEYLNNISTD